MPSDGLFPVPVALVRDGEGPIRPTPEELKRLVQALVAYIWIVVFHGESPPDTDFTVDLRASASTEFNRGLGVHGFPSVPSLHTSVREELRVELVDEAKAATTEDWCSIQ